MTELVHKFVVEIIHNQNGSLVLHDVLFISFVSDTLKLTRYFDEPIFDMNTVKNVVIRLQK